MRALCTAATSSSSSSSILAHSSILARSSSSSFGCVPDAQCLPRHAREMAPSHRSVPAHPVYCAPVAACRVVVVGVQLHSGGAAAAAAVAAAALAGQPVLLLLLLLLRMAALAAAGFIAPDQGLLWLSCGTCRLLGRSSAWQVSGHLLPDNTPLYTHTHTH
jgi:hypothetical protein